MTPKPIVGVLQAFVCLCLLGVMPIVSNGRPDGFPALSFAVFLSVWQLVCALPLFLRDFCGTEKGIFGKSLAPRRRWRSFAVTVVTGILFGLATYLYVLGVERAGAVSAAIAIQAYPLFAILWETIFLKRRKTLVEFVFTAVLVLTLYYLGTGGTWWIEGLSVWFLAALGVPFLWSIAHVIIKEELSNTPITPAQVTFFRVLVSLVFLGGLAVAIDPAVLLRDVVRWDFQIFALAMGAVYYLELIVWFHAMRHIDVSLASSITTPWPALTMVLAAVFLGETVSAYQIVAFCVVVACIYGLSAASIRQARARTVMS